MVVRPCVDTYAHTDSHAHTSWALHSIFKALAGKRAADTPFTQGLRASLASSFLDTLARFSYSLTGRVFPAGSAS